MLGNLLVAAALMTAPAELQTTFETPAVLPDGWVTLGGEWTVADGALRQLDLATRGAYAWDTRQAFADAEVSLRFRAGAAGSGVKAAGLVFRATDSGLGYYLHFDAKSQQVIAVKRTAESDWNELTRRRELPLPTETWHTARLVAAGSTFTVYLDGQEVLAFEDETYPAGYVGVRAGQGELAFDDVQVSGEPVKLPPFQVHRDPNDVSLTPKLRGAESHLAIAEGAGYFPVMVTCADGSLGAVVRAGAPHVGIEGRLEWIRSADGGRTWSAPVVVVDGESDDRNPAVGVMPNGDIVCAYAEATTYDEVGKFDRKAGSYRPKLVISTDGGATWSQPLPLAPEVYDNASPYGRIVTLPDGTALMPIYHWPRTDGQPPSGTFNTAHTSGCGLLRSTDQGRTWGDPSLVAVGYNEFSVARAGDGRLVAVLRQNSGSLAVTESADQGRRWTAPERIAPAGIQPADIIRLDGETMLLVAGCRLTPKGVIAMLSADGGRTWPVEQRAFIAWDGLSGDCGYPSAQRLLDGGIAVIWYSVGTPDLAGPQARTVRFTPRQLRDAVQLP